VARAIPMDSKLGGKDFACTNKYRFRSLEDPRFTDRRMQAMLNQLQANLEHYDIHQLSHILYSTVKLRLPEDALISKTIDLIS